MRKAVHFILTGGTIEKAYDPSAEKPEFLYESILPAYFADIIKTQSAVSFETLCQIDSADMTDDVRAKIVAAVERATAKHIVIVHGTSTMADTLDYMDEHLNASDKTVVLTGAMIPLKEFAMSDGGFNLGYALAAAQMSAPGIYLAMNASLFLPSTVTKDVKIGRFVDL